MSLSAIVEALVEAGATPQIILAAVRAHEGSSTEAVEQRRRSDAERQARRRERVRHVTSRDVTVTERDSPLPLPSSPQTPQQPTPTPESNTRPRKAAPAKPSTPAPDVTELVWQAATKASRDRSGRPVLAKAVLAAIRAGASDAALIASVREHCRAQGEFAKGVDRIVSGEHWRDHLGGPPAPPQAGPVDPAVQARRLRHWRDTGAWDPGWGARPSHPANDALSSQTGEAA